MAEQNPALKRFDVDVCRTGYGFATISVMAANAQEADELALDRAGDYEYSEKNSEYTLVHPAAPAQRPQGTLELMLEMSVDESSPFMRSAVKGAVLNPSAEVLAAWKARAQLCEQHGLSEVRQFADALEVFSRSGRGKDSDSDGDNPCVESVEICWTKGYMWIVAVDRENGAALTSPAVDLDELFELAEAGCERLVVAQDALGLLECLGDERAMGYMPGPATVLMNLDTASQVQPSEFCRFFGVQTNNQRES